MWQFQRAHCLIFGAAGPLCCFHIARSLGLGVSFLSHKAMPVTHAVLGCSSLSKRHATNLESPMKKKLLILERS